jgi:hypothetical protein
LSYLELPRLHFAGRFQADTHTINNVGPYFDNSVFEPRFQRLAELPYHYNGLWNPDGSGSFRMRDVAVTGLSFPDGRFTDRTADDPLLGGRLTDDDQRVSAKMVDLDPDEQMMTEIWGLRLRLLDASGAEVFRAGYDVASITDLWMRYLPDSETQRPDPCCTYQSVLTDVQWAPKISSPFLRALRAASRPDLLSVKFVVDGVQIDPVDEDNVTFGRIVGSIGAYRAGEPAHVVAGRRLNRPDGSRYNAGPAVVDEASRRVFVDLGNSIPTTARGGPLEEVPALRLAVLGDDGKPQVLAPLTGQGEKFYERRSGIVSAELTAEQVAAIAERRLAVVDDAEPPVALLAESDDATMVASENSVFRLYPDGKEAVAEATLVATRFGRPAAGLRIALNPGPESKVGVPGTVTTDQSGRARVELVGSDPGNPRQVVDGQIYSVTYGPPEHPDRPYGRLAVRVFDRHPVPPAPTWEADVQPLFQRYANLFPAMNHVLDLSNYNQVVRYGPMIVEKMLAPIQSPGYMPITRDLSPGKRDMIIKWLQTKPQPPVLRIDTVQDLRRVLQQALLLEHAVIPPYLYALFSLKPNRNREVAEIIRGVVVEEMLHMALVGNILNAVGGTPVIGRPGTVPTYPNRLPAPVLPDLQVRLRRCSVQHVRDVFMAIEQPEYPTVNGQRSVGQVIDRSRVAVDKNGKLTASDATEMKALEDWFVQAEYRPQTIGWFYNEIATAICRLDQGTLFTGDPKRQVSWPDAPGTLYQVTDKRSALLAIYEIIEQGEGSPTDLDGDNIADPEEFGHYYRFKEIVEGRRLIKKPNGKWAYEGEPVRLNAEDVFPVVDDPDTTLLPAGSAVESQSSLCDKTYTDLLTSMNRAFNGHPEEFAESRGLMYALQVEAKKLLTMPNREGASTVAGPAFMSPGLPW